MVKTLINSLTSEVEEMKEETIKSLIDINQDHKFRLIDFTPFFGRNFYLKRNLKYKFANLFSRESEAINLFVDEIKKKENVLNTYNTLLASFFGTAVGYYLVSTIN